MLRYNSLKLWCSFTLSIQIIDNKLRNIDHIIVQILVKYGPILRGKESVEQWGLLVAPSNWWLEFLPFHQQFISPPLGFFHHVGFHTAPHEPLIPKYPQVFFFRRKFYFIYFFLYAGAADLIKTFTLFPRYLVKGTWVKITH